MRAWLATRFPKSGCRRKTGNPRRRRQPNRGDPATGDDRHRLPACALDDVPLPRPARSGHFLRRGGYPKGISFGAVVGARRPEGRDWFTRYHAVRLSVNEARQPPVVFGARGAG